MRTYQLHVVNHLTVKVDVEHADVHVGRRTHVQDLMI